MRTLYVINCCLRRSPVESGPGGDVPCAEVSVGELASTAYGRALLVKLGLFAVLLLGGAYNRMIVHPRLERAALGLDPSDRGAAAALRVSVRAELVLAAVLLVSVAVLVSLPPPG